MAGRSVKLFRWGLSLVILAGLLGGGYLYWTRGDLQPAEAPAGPAQKISLRAQNWMGYCPKEVQQQFKEEMLRTRHWDVDLRVTEAPDLDSMIRLCQTKETDLVTPANDKIKLFREKGLIHPIDVEAIPNFNQIHPALLEHEYYHPDGKVVAVPFMFGPYGLIYNTQKMSKPSTYQVLWDPQYAGRVSISNEFYLANIYLTALMLKMPARNLYNLNDEQLAAVETKLRELCRTQVANYWDGQFDPALRDKIDIATDWGVGVKTITDNKWGEWALSIPDEGATAFVDNWCIAAHVEGPTLEAAQAFINFMLTAAVQADVSRVTTYSPVNFYATRHFKPEEKIQNHVNDPNYLNRLILWQALSPENAARYEAVWKRAKP